NSTSTRVRNCAILFSMILTHLLAPIWFTLITNVLAIAFTVFLLEDAREEIDEIKTEESSNSLSFSSIREKLNHLRTLNLPFILIAIVLFEKIVSGLFNSTSAAIGGPILTSLYALTGQEIVMLMAISQVGNGSE
ncbi:hypothetical protein PMAYCL1PPCAC_17394, partial [Pristionchus mayeri]